MRNKHKFTSEITVTCPYNNCGKVFSKKVTVEYVTNQKGDVIEKNMH